MSNKSTTILCMNMKQNEQMVGTHPNRKKDKWVRKKRLKTDMHIFKFISGKFHYIICNTESLVFL